MANPFALAGAPEAAQFDLHFVRYRRVHDGNWATSAAGTTLAWCTCGWTMLGESEAVLAAAATHDLGEEGR